MNRLLQNLALYLGVFLPVAVLTGMVVSHVTGTPPSPDWDAGWNPLLWLVFTAPWLLPTIALVPVLYLSVRALIRWQPRWNARLLAVLVSPALFASTWLGLWGADNFTFDLVAPVIVAAVVFGLVLRLPPGAEEPSEA